MSSTYSQQYSNNGEIVLTPYGSIWIKPTSPSPIKLNFLTNARGQVIEFRRADNSNLIATFIHVNEQPIQIILEDGDRVISNDQSIINAVNNYDVNMTINPFSKILIYYPNINTIYTNTPDFNTIIYSEVPLILGSDSPNNINDAVINTKVTIVSTKEVKIRNNIIYSNFPSLQDYINQIEKQDRISISNNNNGLLRVIAPQITFDTSQFSATDPNRNKLCLNGQFVTMYDLNSKITISNPDNIQQIYLFGSIQFCQRENFTSNFREKYLLDGRLTTIDPALSTILDNIDNNTYINKISVLGIEIINK